MFEQIYFLHYTTSSSGKKDKCILSCKVKKKLQIIVFDYYDDGNEFEDFNEDDLNLKRKKSLLEKLRQKKTGEVYKDIILHT